MKLTGEHIFIKRLETSDAAAKLDMELRNRDFFQTYVPLREEDFYTLDGQLARIRKDDEGKEQNEHYAFGIFLKETSELIGEVTLSEVERGPLQSCWIGYYLDKHHNGKGYMTEAVRLAVDYAFNELKLHRIQAGVMPHNIASMKLLEKAGFHREGIAKDLVKINGRWEDHQMLAIVNENDS